MATENEHIILAVANLLKEKTKNIALEQFRVHIWDVANLLWLFDENPQMKSDFISLLSFSVSEIEPQKTKPDLRIQPEPEDYSQELQEKLRRIEPGRDNFKKYETICSEILRYVFADDLEFLGNQWKSNDGLYRIDLCCKIKHGVENEFFDTVRSYFHTKYIVFEFKNYNDEIEQGEIYTTEKYLYDKALRKVAIILSRKGASQNAQKAARGCLRENGKLIMCLSDMEINQLLEMKRKSETPADLLEEILDEMLMVLEK